MTAEKLKEFSKRLRAEGCVTNFDERGAGVVSDGKHTAIVMEDGEVRFKPENRDFGHRVYALLGEVDEYMTAFLAASPKGDNTRTLMLYAGHELAARRLSNGGMDFVTWQLDRNGERELGHYYDSYTEAKEDFALRAGLIDRNKVFSEKELTVIRSSLSEYLDIAGSYRNASEHEDIARDVIAKIDDVIAPEIDAQAENADEQGFEPEMEL